MVAPVAHKDAQTDSHVSVARFCGQISSFGPAFTAQDSAGNRVFDVSWVSEATNEFKSTGVLLGALLSVSIPHFGLSLSVSERKRKRISRITSCRNFVDVRDSGHKSKDVTACD